ncbi:DUF4254 domain-containing protein [Nocardia sp. BMG51109]|uniref:DUF4254 domain-containing protein n=1 Tax=Nocardia sp. BMG51109 TaxID=1056816 RepID=UPI0004652119|nr:DUF4254 domain-containing protein [Nocardia sp. BMG51109]
MVKLPSKDQLLDACTGTGLLDHPVLHDACELARLHATRRADDVHGADETDCARAELVYHIDRWVTTHMPRPIGAAYLHSESVGMIVDRFAEYCVAALAALEDDATELHRHFLWQRLGELAVAYTDLAVEITAGLRKLPNLVYPPPDHDQMRAGASR